MTGATDSMLRFEVRLREISRMALSFTSGRTTLASKSLREASSNWIVELVSPSSTSGPLSSGRSPK